MPPQKIGLLLLRLAMAGVYLYFGFSQLFDGVNWAGYVPMWVSNFAHLPPVMLVLGNGLFEVVAAALLAAGVLVGPVAILLAIHLFFIAFSIGVNPIGVRDLGLALATLSLFFLSRKTISVE